MAYTDKSKIEGFLDTTLDARTDGQLSFWIEAVTEWINRYCGTDFEDGGGDVTKYYDGVIGSTLRIDPVTAVTTLLILDESGNTLYTLTEGAGNDFLLYPLNATEKTEVRLINSATVYSFGLGNRRVAITGRFRSATSVPAAVSLAATKLVGKLITEQAGKDVKKEQLGDYSIEYGLANANIDESANALGITNILDQYRVYSL